MCSHIFNTKVSTVTLEQHTDFDMSSKQHLLELYTSAFRSNTALGGEIYTESVMVCVQVSLKANHKTKKYSHTKAMKNAKHFYLSPTAVS